MELSTRAAYRGQVTKITKTAIDYLNSAESSVKDENLTRLDAIEEEITFFVQRLTAVHESLNLVNTDVRAKSLLKTDELDKEMEKIAEYEDLAIGVLARLHTRLKKVHAKVDPAADQTTEEAFRHNTTTAKSNSAKLPKLQLKKFSGKFEEWLCFWEQFRSTVHENQTLTGAEKFSYLETVLAGEAQKTISGFTATEACYDGAIALLQEQYGDTERLIDRNIQQLLSLNPVKSRDDVSGLRHLYNSVVSSSRSLTALKVPANHYEVMLKSILLRCLPSVLRVDYHRISDNSGSDRDKEDRANSVTASSASSTIAEVEDKQVQGLLRFIKREVESLERALTEKSRQISASSRRDVHTTVAGLMAASASEPCLFCKSSKHYATECDSDLQLIQKKDLLKREGRCYKCTRRGHTSGKCRNRWITCKKCNGKHITTLCDPSYKISVGGQSSYQQTSDTRIHKLASSKEKAPQVLNLCAHDREMQSNYIFLKTACCVAVASTHKSDLLVRVIIDGGSQHTYIRESVANKLDLLTIGYMRVAVVPFGGRELSPCRKLRKVKLLLRSQFNSENFELDALVVPEICVDVLKAPDETCSAFEGLQLADVQSVNIKRESGLSILIGGDFYWTVVTGKQKSLTKHLRAVQTIFGWTLQGPHTVSTNSSNINHCFASYVNFLNAFEVTEMDLSQLWSLDAIGIQAEEREHKTLTDDLIGQCISKREHKYVASLPWKDRHVHIDSNREGAILRLRSLIRKLSSDPNKILDYDKAMRELISCGFAESVSEKEDEGCVKRIYYLPYRAVYRQESATTKTRIVFDASAHAKHASSLNDHLNTGSNLLADVLKIMLNFRIGKYGIVADNEKAFLQIDLNEEDRDSHRFFWFADEIKSGCNLPEVQVYRMTKVTFGVTCSPFLLAATIREHINTESKNFPSTCSLLKDSFYMDDLVMGIDSEIEGQRIFREATSIMTRASMTLRKWNSNSEGIRGVFQSSNFPKLQKVLGLQWFTTSDELTVSLDAVEDFLKSCVERGSKRTVLQVIARVFDPLGMLSPTVIRWRILFQKIWKKKLAWDEVLTEDLLNEWCECVKQLKDLKNVAVPRSVLDVSSSITTHLHIFADASLQAYGTVAYVWSKDSSDQVRVEFLCAKSRVAPIKQDGSKELTLPKLELTAAMLAARLGCYLQKFLRVKIAKCWFWSDSKIALYWIRGGIDKWKPFIQNRVIEIQHLTEISAWRHCSGKENPADLLTRGITGRSLLASNMWLHGPEWLREISEDWIDLKQNSENISALINLFIETKMATLQPEEALLNYAEVSTWRRLLRITGYVQRFVRILKGVEKPSSNHLTAENLRIAEQYWIRYLQSNMFPEEIFLLKQGKPISKSSKLYELTPFLDEEGVLRLGGRLQYFEESSDVKHPVILPSTSHLCALIINDCHEKTMHGGVNIIITHLRKRFWIIKGRQLVKRIIKSCYLCRKLWGKPMTQPFAPLPRERLSISRPFDNVGIDFAGLLYIHDAGHENTSRKIYIMICACTSVRAVHLELVKNLSTENCIMALRRFIARRGVPAAIYSDNAQTFRRAALELNTVGQLFDNEALQGFLAHNRINWHFIVERAPWWGGFWERLIRTVKNMLKVVIGKATIDFDQLHTLIIEAEGIINARPLTYVSSDPLDISPLTPAHFLLGGHPSISPTASKEEETSNEIRRKWTQRMKLTAMIWKRWKTEYVQLLRSFHHNKGQASTEIREEDVVLVYDAAAPRIHWKLAIIKTTYPGRDGRVRSCEIQYSNGKTTRRPVQLLYPLELSTARVEDVKNKDHSHALI